MLIKISTTLIILSMMLSRACENKNSGCFTVEGEQSKIIKKMIDAVNEKDPEKYVKQFAENVQVVVGSEIKVEGREAVKKNRASHFLNHPDVRSEIQHLVEIDNKVIMHDKVWLRESDQFGQDIVEIFTFENGLVVRVDVIQPKDLFKN